MKKLFTVLAIVAVFGTQMTPVFAATVTRSSQTTSVTQTEEAESLEPETEDVVVEEESEVVEPEAETEDVVVEEESEVVEPETEDVVVEDTPMLYSVGETGRTPYEKTPVETTDVAIQTFGVEQVNEFALGQVSSYVDPSVVADKQAAIAELEALTPQSPQPYEVAVVNEANEYFFIEGQPTYEDAVALTQTIELFAGEEAVVINENGMVTYSNSNVARVFKTIDGKLYYGCDINTTLYRDASLGTSVGYINQCYTDDVSVLAIQGDAAKIMVAGKVAWLRISSDLVFVSTNQIANPSYYANENGHFVHYISKNLTTPSSGGTKLELGPKNNKLQDNVKYYSYDGNYFYTNPETIGPDMNDGVANSAVNANDPYYNYFQNLPFNSKAVATAAQIDAYINANTQATSKLRNTGQAFIDAQNKYGINALLMLGIAINESNWGMSSIAQSKNNLFGLNAVDATPGESADYFPTVAACIDLYASDWLAQGYADPQDWRYYGGMLGNKSMGANVKYASDAYWSEKAVAHMYTVDRGINGGTSKEWNYYSLGWFTAPNSVKSSNGQVIYPITAPDSNGVLSLYSSYTNTPIILKETNASDGKYEVWPARNNTLSSSNNVPASLPYNWNGGEYISTSGVKVVNTSNNQGIQSDYQNILNKNNRVEITAQLTYGNGEGVQTSSAKLELESTKGNATVVASAVKSTSDMKLHDFGIDPNQLVIGDTYKVKANNGVSTQYLKISTKYPVQYATYGNKQIQTRRNSSGTLELIVTSKQGIQSDYQNILNKNNRVEITAQLTYGNGEGVQTSSAKLELESTKGNATVVASAVKSTSDMKLHDFGIDPNQLVVGDTYKVKANNGVSTQYLKISTKYPVQYATYVNKQIQTKRNLNGELEIIVKN